VVRRLVTPWATGNGPDRASDSMINVWLSYALLSAIGGISMRSSGFVRGPVAGVSKLTANRPIPAERCET
jgi:hypothetical protein